MEWVFPWTHANSATFVREAFTNACQHGKLAGVIPYTLKQAFEARYGGSQQPASSEVWQVECKEMILRQTPMSG